MGCLPGIKEISQYCRRSESTILKWIKLYEFPAIKFGGCWESDTELVDEWRKNQIRKGLKNNRVKRENW